MGRRHRAPRSVIEWAWSAGIRGRNIWIPAERSRSDEVLTDLLRRAEGRVLEVEVARAEVIRAMWGSIREESTQLRASQATVSSAMTEAVLEIGRWWRTSEGKRLGQVKRMGPRGKSEYRQIRAVIRRAASPAAARDDVAGFRPELIASAALSVASCWWWRDMEEVGLLRRHLYRELAVLAVFAAVQVGAGVEVRERAMAMGARAGLDESEVLSLGSMVAGGVEEAEREFVRMADEGAA